MFIYRRADGRPVTTPSRIRPSDCASGTFRSDKLRQMSGASLPHNARWSCQGRYGSSVYGAASYAVPLSLNFRR
jgi:hypothetical protein